MSAADKRLSELTAPVSIADTDVLGGYRPGTGGNPNLDIQASVGLIRAPIIVGLADGSVAVAASGVVTAPNVVTGRTGMSAQDKLYSLPDVREWGASTARTDNEVPINAAIAEIAALSSGSLTAGGRLMIPTDGQQFTISAPILAKNNVHIVGGGDVGRVRYNAQCRLVAAAGFSGAAMITQTASTFVTGFGVRGVAFYSAGGSANHIDGIQLNDPVGLHLRGCTWQNFGGRAVAVMHDASSGGANPIACYFSDIFVYDALKDTTTLLANAVATGAVHIEGVDHEWSGYCEVGRNVGSLSDTNLYGAGLHWAASNGRLSGGVCQLSDIGLRITGSFNSIVNMRCDRNYGHGVLVSGNYNSLVSVRPLNNSRAVTNTYDQIQCSGASNRFEACDAYWNSATDPSTQPKYSFNDQNSSATASAKNIYNSRGFGHATSQFKVFSASFPPMVQLNSGPAQTITMGVGVTSVTMDPYVNTFRMTNSAARTFINFNGIPMGATIRIICDGNTTFQHLAYSTAGATNGFCMKTGADETPAAGVVKTFYAHFNLLLEC